MATAIDIYANGVHLTIPAAKVALSPSTAGILHAPHITPESAKSASELLQENHANHHVFFNQRGFHNHITHQMLTIFALGATPNQLSQGYAVNQSYQRPQLPADTNAIKQMSSSRDKVASFYGQEKYYHAYQEFFEQEIETKGIKATLEEWLFQGDAVAEGLLTRMFASLLHPIIHLGFALEFHQPAILAESLSQAAVHKDSLGPYLLNSERAAAVSAPSATKPNPSLISLLHSVRSDPQIRRAVSEAHGVNPRDGLLTHAADAMTSIASRWTVAPTTRDIRFKTAEMIQAATYFTAAAQNPCKIPKFDFFYIHCTNAGIFYSAFADDPANQKLFGLDDDGDSKDTESARRNLARLLEMKTRADLAWYATENSPVPDLDRVRNYHPKHPEQQWPELFARVCAFPDDDGHIAKLVRAVANGERVCRGFEAEVGEQDWPVRGDMWLKIAHMVVDSVEAGGPRWVRHTGWDSAWTDVPDRTGEGLKL